MKAWPNLMPSPEISHCLVCEDVRLERRNLASFMGVYGVLPYVGIKIKNFQLPVQFCLVFLGGPTQGRLVAVPEFHSSDGKQISAELFPERFEFNFLPETESSVMAFKVKANFPRPDIYRVILTSDRGPLFNSTFRLLPGIDADFT